jgi:Rod binding domain-containing protein
MSVSSALSTAGPKVAPWQVGSRPAAEAVERFRQVNQALKTASINGDSAESSAGAKPDQQGSPELRKAFNSFVGEALFGQLLAQMRKTVGKPAYFHGGQAEEIFRGQLDQVLSQRLTESAGHSFSDRLFEQQFVHEWTA